MGESATEADLARFLTPKRAGTFTKLPGDELDLYLMLIRYMRGPLTPVNDQKEAIIYAAKSFGKEINAKRYIKVGWSSQVNEQRVYDIKDICEVSIEEHFYTPPFKGAWRAEQLFRKLFAKDKKLRLGCKCDKINHEWFDKDLASVRHWILTIYLWIGKNPYDLDTGELTQEWQTALDEWEESLYSARPIAFEEFLMLGPHFGTRLISSPWGTRVSKKKTKSSPSRRPGINQALSAPDLSQTPTRLAKRQEMARHQSAPVINSTGSPGSPARRAQNEEPNIRQVHTLSDQPQISVNKVCTPSRIPALACKGQNGMFIGRGSNGTTKDQHNRRMPVETSLGHSADVRMMLKLSSSILERHGLVIESGNGAELRKPVEGQDPWYSAERGGKQQPSVSSRDEPDYVLSEHGISFQISSSRSPKSAERKTNTLWTPGSAIRFQALSSASQLPRKSAQAPKKALLTDRFSALDVSPSTHIKEGHHHDSQCSATLVSPVFS